MKKKLCSILLALTMVLTLLPVSALAKGGTATSLPDAVDGVITLTEDVELTNGLNYTTDVTIVLNGHTITRTNGQKTALMITNGATMTIDGSVAGSAINGTIVVGYSTPSVTNGKLIINGGTYTATVNDDCVVQTNGLCDNCEITATNATFNSTDDTFYLAGNGTYRLENCEINGYTGIYMKSGSLTLNNTTIKATGEYAAPVANGNGASSTGDGIILDAKTGYKGNIDLNINGGSISSNNAYAIRETYTDSTATATHSITVNGGTYTSSKDAINVSEYFKQAVASGVSSISISGGTFSDLSALDYLAEGANVTVKLAAANTQKDVVIPANTTVTLDLNGHKIVNSATAQDKEVPDASRKHTITNNGTLTILDSVGGGVVDNVSHGRAALYNAGTIVEIKGGKFTRSVDNSTDATSAKGNSWYVVYNAEGANITKISSGEFLALGHFSSLFCNSGTINEISGGTFTQDGFIAFKNEGTVNKISGGTFSSESESCIQNWGTIGEISDGTITAGRIGIWNFSSDTYKSAGTISRITGGNISGTTAAIRLNDYDTDYKDSDKNVTAPSTVNKANASISAGNFSGALEVNANTVLTITGGTYTSDPSAYVVPGYVASYNGSTYTVYYPVPVIPNNNNNSSSTTTKNPDGSTTTTTTDKATGAVTETTTTANGSVGTVKTDANGSTEISASISAADVKAAEQKNAPIIAPITVTPAASSAAAPIIKLSVPANAGEVAVAIPVVNAKQGTVAVKVNPDGTEEIIKTAVITENGLVLGVKGSMQIKVINNSKNFVDTVGHWAASDVDFVSARELFNGTAPALFSPEASMTRGMVVTVIARLAGENTDGGANWYDKGCAWAVANGVSDGTDPNGSITREQLAAMLYRYCGSPAASGSLSAYADAASVSAFASDAMQWCVNNGIINGMDGLLNPQGQATRAQVSAMFARYIRMAAAK